MCRGDWQTAVHGGHRQSDTTEELSMKAHTHTHTHTHTHAQIRKPRLKETEVLPPRSRSLTMLVPDLNSNLLNS